MGELLLARDRHGEPVPKARGFGLGRALIDAIVREAVRIGYS